MIKDLVIELEVKRADGVMTVQAHFTEDTPEKERPLVTADTLGMAIGIVLKRAVEDRDIDADDLETVTLKLLRHIQRDLLPHFKTKIPVEKKRIDAESKQPLE